MGYDHDQMFLEEDINERKIYRYTMRCSSQEDIEVSQGFLERKERWYENIIKSE